MTAIDDLLARLARTDVRLSVDGAKLVVDAPAGALSETMRSELAARKAEILERLASRDAGADAEVLLSSSQERLLSLLAARGQTSAWHVAFGFDLEGPLDVERFGRALETVVSRHEALRTSFPADGAGRRRPFVHAPAPIALRTPSPAPGSGAAGIAAAEQGLDSAIRDEACRAFDLANGPLWRALLANTAPDRHRFVFVAHHLIFDGRSRAVLLAEIAEVYRATGVGEEPRLASPAPRYSDYVRWRHARENEAARQAQVEYWARKFAGSPAELRLPLDRPRTAVGTDGCRFRAFELPPATLATVRAVARQLAATEYMVLLASVCAWFARQTSQDDLIVCAPLAGRDRGEFEGLIGRCNTFVALRIDAGANPAFAELVARSRSAVLEAWQHQHVPLQVVAALPGLVRVPLARAIVNYQDAAARRFDLPGIVARPVEVRTGAADVDFALQLEATIGGGLAAVVELRADLFDAATADRFVDGWSRLLEAAVADPARSLASLPGAPDEDEVENWLNAHPKVDRAVVVRRSPDRSATAYVQLDRDDPPSHAEIRDALAGAFPAWKLPAAVVTVARFARLPDGRIDRDALPPPPMSVDRPREQPRTTLERRLAAIWKRTLWLDREIGVEEDFVELGGHSLLSAQLVVEVEREFGRALPDHAIAGLSTVAAMARALESDATVAPVKEGDVDEATAQILHRQRAYVASWVGVRARPDGLVLGLNVDGGRCPVFWCLQGYGELLQLARYMGPDQPVFGMRSDFGVMERTESNLARLSARYADELAQIRPAGAFVLGGNCGAAHVTMPLARELARRGREVSLLFLHENFLAEPYDGRVALLFGAQSDRNPCAYYAEPWVGWRKYYTGTLTLDIVEGAHGEFFVEPNVQILVSAIRRRMDELERGAPPADALPLRSGMQILPPEATKASLAIRSLTPVGDGRRIDVVVDVTNASPIGWTAGPTSGIALVNRWLEVDQRPLVLRDARSVLPVELPPGESVTLTLATTVPPVERDCLLMIDLVDEGVTEFWRAGSSPCAIVIRATG